MIISLNKYCKLHRSHKKNCPVTMQYGEENTYYLFTIHVFYVGYKTKRESGGQMAIQTYLNDFKFSYTTLL